jgi:twitching motility protein PilI
MAAKSALREYQRRLMERLEAGAEDAAPRSSQLAFESGGEKWLVPLNDIAEVIALPAITPVPLARDWFLGLANVRGNLYGIADFAALSGRPATSAGSANRLLLLAAHVIRGSGLLVARIAGLRSPDQFKIHQGERSATPWIRALLRDEAGVVWNEIDAPQLVRSPEFLQAGI